MSDLTDWKPRAAPGPAALEGKFVAVAPASAPECAADVFNAIGGPDNDDLWRFIPFGPFADAAALGAALVLARERMGWKTHLFRAPGSDRVLGMASYMRIRPEHGSAEIGCIVFSKAMQQTPAATEAMYLMARHVFDDLGYRRYEWKCDDANTASKRAAVRLGFTFEGVFRRDMVVKGRNRDTAWFSMIDAEWPAVKAAFEAWLAPGNFDGEDRQKRRLEDIRAALS